MSYNTKNYSENGDKLVIGGTLEVLNGAKLSGFPVAENQALSAGAFTMRNGEYFVSW